MIDKKYVAKRNKLIPFAERYANERFGRHPSGNRDMWITNWNSAFHGEMTRLWRLA